LSGPLEEEGNTLSSFCDVARFWIVWMSACRMPPHLKRADQEVRMRVGGDLERKFLDLFHSMQYFC